MTPPLNSEPINEFLKDTSEDIYHTIEPVEKPFDTTPFKPPSDTHHEAQPSPVTQPSIYDRSGYIDIRERRKVMVERMGCGGQGIGVFKPSTDKNEKK